jgi:hypothetical protein
VPEVSDSKNALRLHENFRRNRDHTRDIHQDTHQDIHGDSHGDIHGDIHRDIDWIRLSVWLWYVKALLQVEGVMPWQGVASLKKHGNDLYV